MHSIIACDITARISIVFLSLKSLVYIKSHQEGLGVVMHDDIFNITLLNENLAWHSHSVLQRECDSLLWVSLETRTWNARSHPVSDLHSHCRLDLLRLILYHMNILHPIMQWFHWLYGRNDEIPGDPVPFSSCNDSFWCYCFSFCSGIANKIKAGMMLGIMREEMKSVDEVKGKTHSHLSLEGE